MMTAAIAVQEFEAKYTLYRNIYFYCGIAALFFLLIAIILFFSLRIPQVFGELTGRTARKAVEEMNNGQSKYTKKKSKKKIKNQKTQKKENIKSSYSNSIYSNLIGEDDTPARLVTQDDIPTPERMPEKNGEVETSVLMERETDVLSGNESEVETTVFSERELQTVVLENDNMETDILQMNSDFIVVRSMVEIHTDEVIEI